MLQESVQRLHERRASTSLGLTAFQDRRACFDVARRMANTKSFTAVERFSIKSIACCGVWTNDRARDSGFITDGTCPLCGEADSLYHRMWSCNHPDVKAAREAVTTPKALRRVWRDPDKDRWVTPALPHPADIAPRPSSELMVKIRASDDSILEGIPGDYTMGGGYVVMDGSCPRHIIKDLNRAGWCLSLYDPGSEQPRVTISGPVWDPLPQILKLPST